MACGLRASGSVKESKAGRRGKGRTFKLKTRTRTLSRPTNATLRMELSKRDLKGLRRLLKRGRKFSATVTVTATAGSQSVKSRRTIKIKR